MKAARQGDAAEKCGDGHSGSDGDNDRVLMLARLARALPQRLELTSQLSGESSAGYLVFGVSITHHVTSSV